jgi:hypothetical protein
MKRTDIEAEYTIENGVIRNPGKFEGEPIYAPYFWDALLNGFADSDDDGVAVFDIEASDIEQFPELANVERIALYESDQGFVYLESTFKG